LHEQSTSTAITSEIRRACFARCPEPDGGGKNARAVPGAGSRAAGHVRKMSICFASKAAFFAGVWGVPNKQSD